MACTSVLSYPGQTPEARVLTPPHSTSARGYDNLHYHNHDLVAISMGTGGWVFKIKSRLHTRTRVLEPKCHDDICGSTCTVCVCVVCIMSLRRTSVCVRNVLIGLPSNGSPKDK